MGMNLTLTMKKLIFSACMFRYKKSPIRTDRCKGDVTMKEKIFHWSIIILVAIGTSVVVNLVMKTLNA